MTYRVAFSAKAQRDLQEVADYVARDSAIAAVRLIRRLRQACVEIGEGPLRYPLLYDDEIRRRVIGAYNIYYRTRPQHVEILRIMHAARDQQKPT